MKLKNCILLIIMVAAQLSFAQKNKPKKTGIISSDSFKIIQSSLMYKIKYEGLNRVIESKVQMLTEDFTKLDTLLSVDSLREAFFRNELPTIDLQEVQISPGTHYPEYYFISKSNRINKNTEKQTIKITNSGQYALDIWGKVTCKGNTDRAYSEQYVNRQALRKLDEDKTYVITKGDCYIKPYYEKDTIVIPLSINPS